MFLVPHAAAQSSLNTDADVRFVDADGQPVAPSFITVRAADGSIKIPAGGFDGTYAFVNVGRKLTFELAQRGLKTHSFDLVLEDAPKVFVEMLVDPVTARVKSITQKGYTPQSDPDKKIRRMPGGQQQAVVPPANDSCGSPTPIFAGATPFTTVEATTDGPANCSGSVFNDVWYSYVATGTGTLTVSTCNAATFDTKIAIYSGLTCPPGAPIGCNDDFTGCSGFTSTATAAVTVGNSYLIRIGAFGSTQTGTGTVTITPPAGPPPFDECENDETVACNSSTMFNNATATTNPTDPAFSCRFGGPGQGFGTSWFKFVATGTSATIDTNGSSTGDTLLAVYSGGCGSLVELACDDDSGTGLLSSLTVTGLTIGETYAIQVAGFGASNVGANVLNISCFGTVAGDECDDPIMASCDSSVTLDLSTLTESVDDPAYSCRFGAPGQGFGTGWISFVATDTSVVVDTNLSTGASDTMLALYDGSCGSLVELCCDDDSGTGLLSQFCCEGLTIGNTYLIQVSSFDVFSLGEATVTIECPCPAPPPNDECDGAIALGPPPISIGVDTTLATDDIGVPCGVGSGPFNNVWYTVTGTGNTITATTCSLATTHPDTKISVFCGECLAPVCVAGNDDNCPNPIFASTVSWCSQAGVQYLVTLGGFSPAQVGFAQLDFIDGGIACDPDVQCQPEGACCLPDGSCDEMTSDDCVAAGGLYLGDGTTCGSNAVTDGSFEAGIFSGNWVEMSTNFGTPLCDSFCGFGGGTGPFDGNFWAWFGGIPAFEEGSVSQNLTIPTSASTLDFYLEIPVSSGNGFDFLEVTIDGNQIYLAMESDGPYVGYLPVSVPLGGFADGGVHTLEFHSIISGDDGSGGAAFTNFFVDLISIESVSVNCPQPTGACCFLDGSCIDGLEEADCTGMGGTYQGDDTTCLGSDCPQPLGACCLMDGSCVEVTEEDCAALGGTYNGDFTDCGSVSCITCFALDFSTDDSGAGMVHGQHINTEFDGGANYPVTITASVNASGSNSAAILNSNTGPAIQDPDLLVGSGNILIMQTDANLTECPPASDIYCSHNDDEDGGTISFAFNVAAIPSSIDLIDIDSVDPVSTVVLTDAGGKTRTYTVPGGWTGDLVTNFTSGMGTLNLTVLAPQPGFASVATAVEDAGFDAAAVLQIDVNLGGSGAVDNLNWCQVGSGAPVTGTQIRTARLR
jgi:hypothetical protein